eukprot:m.94161 g.94161  ORF g.94161 m.94161 type:complete len:98 (-) comp13016_c0_seq2:226-519(-)
MSQSGRQGTNSAANSPVRTVLYTWNAKSKVRTELIVRVQCCRQKGCVPTEIPNMTSQLSEGLLRAMPSCQFQTHPRNTNDSCKLPATVRSPQDSKYH